MVKALDAPMRGLKSRELAIVIKEIYSMLNREDYEKREDATEYDVLVITFSLA
jgi:hypothetical protein